MYRLSRNKWTRNGRGLEEISTKLEANGLDVEYGYLH